MIRSPIIPQEKTTPGFFPLDMPGIKIYVAFNFEKPLKELL